MPFAACLEELLLPYALGLSETERAGLQIWHEGTGMLAELPTKSTMGGGLRAGELVSGASSEACEAPGAGDTELCLQLAVYDAREGAPATFMPSPLPPPSPARSSPTCSPPGTLGSLKKKENFVCGLPRLVWLRSKKSFASPYTGKVV